MNWKSWLVIVGILAAAAAALGLTMKGKPKREGKGSPQGDKVREAAVAGLFYPKEKDVLAAMIDSFLGSVGAPQVENVRGLVCPHAGYRFSGQTAAYSYKQLMGRDVRTVVVMAPSHYSLFRGASIPDVTAYRTPLGTVELSPKAKELAKIGPLVSNPPSQVRRPPWWRESPKKAPPVGEDTPHTWEHSLEVQIPFLQRTLKDFSIIPIVFGQVDAEKVARALVRKVDAKTVLVASSDLSHYYPYDVARRKDASCTKAICDLDIERMKKEEACGKAPILTLMHIARQKGWKAKLLDYRNSGDTAGDKSGVVGYAAVVFYEPKK
ncbi:AmmeMemoRadiSam system protein B [bacterium]|nr:AmmeMemoRadiSam system protein B [bacterium]